MDDSPSDSISLAEDIAKYRRDPPPLKSSRGIFDPKVALGGKWSLIPVHTIHNKPHSFKGLVHAVHIIHSLKRRQRSKVRIFSGAPYTP